MWLVDEETNELYTCVAEGLDALNGVAKEIRIDINTGIVGHVVCSGETFSCVDAYDSNKFNANVDRSSGYRTRQILCVPLISKTSKTPKIVGAIQVVNRADTAESISSEFSASEEQLLVTLGEQIVTAVEQCHSHASSEAEKQQSLIQLKQMQSQLQRARTSGQQLDGLLSNLSEVISGQASLQSLMDTVLEQGCELVGADRAALFILDEAKNELWTFIGRGEESRVIHIPVGEGIAGTVARTGDTVNIKDAYLDIRFSRATDRSTGYRTQSILAAAVKNKKNKIVGVLQLINKLDAQSGERIPFEPQDESMVEHFSTEIGGALESGARAEESKKSLENMKRDMKSMQSHMKTQMVKTKKQASIMINLAKDLSAINTKETLLGRIIKDATTLLDASSVVMYLVDDATKELCGHGVKSDDAYKSISIADRGMVGKVYRSGTSMDDEIDGTYVLCIPIGDGEGDLDGDNQGVLEVKSDRAFDEDAKNLAAGFSSHVALGLSTFDRMSSSNAHMLELSKKLEDATRNGGKLKEFSKALADDLETSALFQQVVGHSRDILRADRATLFLVDSETNELYSMVAEGAGTIRIPRGVGIAGHVVTTGKTVNIPDCYADPRFNRDTDVRTGYRTQSMICMMIPDVHGAGAIGCLQLMNKLPENSHKISDALSFDKDDEALLKNLVVEVAIAVDHMSKNQSSASELAKLNAQLATMEEQLNKTDSTSQQLLEFAKELAATSELSEVFEAAITDARHLVQADRATLWLVDEETNELYTCVAEGLDSASGEVKEVRIAIGKGIVGHVVCSGETFSCDDACKFVIVVGFVLLMIRVDKIDANLICCFYSTCNSDDCDKFNPSVDTKSGYRTRQILCVPMISSTLGRQSVIGAIQVVNCKESTDSFTTEDENVLNSFIGQISGAVERCLRTKKTANKEKDVFEQVKHLEAACTSSETLSNVICTTCDIMLRSSIHDGPSKHECFLFIASSIKTLIRTHTSSLIVRMYLINPDTNELEFIVCDKPHGTSIGAPSATIDGSSHTIVATAARSLKPVHYDATSGRQSYTIDMGTTSEELGDWQQNQNIEINDIVCAVSLPIVQTVNFDNSGADVSPSRASFNTPTSVKATPSLVGVVEILCLKPAQMKGTDATSCFSSSGLSPSINYLKMIAANLQQISKTNHYSRDSGTSRRESGASSLGRRRGSSTLETTEHSLANAIDFGPILLNETLPNAVQQKLSDAHELLFGAESVTLWTLQSRGTLVPFGSSSRPHEHRHGKKTSDRHHHNKHHNKHHHHRHHHGSKHHNQQNDHHSNKNQDWMQADTGPAGHCLSTGDIVNLTQASGTYGRNCGVDIVTNKPIVVHSVLCCPVEVQGRRIGVLQILNSTSGAFDSASDVHTVQLVSILLAEWMNRWDMRHQLESLEMACSTMRSAARKNLEEMRTNIKDMSYQMEQQDGAAKKNLQTTLEHEQHDWKANLQHAKEMEHLHRLNHVLRHGILSRAFHKIEKYNWLKKFSMLSDELSNKKILKMKGISKVRSSLSNIVGKHSVRRYGLKWGFEMLSKTMVPMKMMEMFNTQRIELSKKREVLRLHGIKIRQATSRLQQLDCGDKHYNTASLPSPPHLLSAGKHNERTDASNLDKPEVKISRRGSVSIHIPSNRRETKRSVSQVSPIQHVTSHIQTITLDTGEVFEHIPAEKQDT